MADTFLLTDVPEAPVFSQELPTNAVTGHPYLSHVAPMCLFNPSGSGKKLRVRRVDIMPQVSQTSGGGRVTYDLYRITAHTASTDLIAAMKHDANNADMPSQVVCCRYPEAITVSGASIDSHVFAPNASVTRALGGIWVMAGRLAGRLAGMDAVTAENQRITLREGQGIGVSVASSAATTPWRWQVSIGVRVVATGACYRYTFPLTPNEKPLFSLLNASGSGVVLEVTDLTYAEIGTDELPQFAVEPIDGLSQDHGDALTPVSLDSSNSVGSVFAKRNGVYAMKGSKVGALISIPHVGWAVPTLNGVGPGYANAVSCFEKFRPRVPHATEFDIVLNEGEGIAITNKNASAIGKNRFSILFSVSDGDANWSVTGTFKNSSDANLPDGTTINAYHATTHVKVGSARLRGGVVTVPVSTPDNVYLVADPAGLSGETVCTTAITPTAG